MAKCLRCGAGAEWIEGDVKPEPPPEPESRFTCPKCGSHYWATRGHGGPLEEWIGYCKGGRYGEQPTLCDFEWMRTDDGKYGLPSREGGKT